MKAIQMKNVTKSYGEVKALDGVSLEVDVGSVFGFIGPNGAGKTTTIKLLMGMIRPTKGTIQIFDKEITGSDYSYLHNIGYVPEECNLYKHMNLKDLISLTKGFYKKWDQILVDKYTNYFQLPTDTPIGKFSKGMKVKASLILAIAHDPKLIILDEPTSGLDPIFRRDFLNIVIEELTLAGKTVFFSSHIIDDVERIADKVGILNKGKLVKVKNVDELKVNEKKIRVVFQRDIGEAFFEIPGIEKVETKGNAHIITVSDHFEEIYQKCKEQPHFAIEVVEQSLEDILINTSRR